MQFLSGLEQTWCICLSTLATLCSEQEFIKNGWCKEWNDDINIVCTRQVSVMSCLPRQRRSRCVLTPCKVDRNFSQETLKFEWITFGRWRPRGKDRGRRHALTLDTCGTTTLVALAQPAGSQVTHRLTRMSRPFTYLPTSSQILITLPEYSTALLLHKEIHKSFIDIVRKRND